MLWRQTVAADRDDALEWFSERLPLMLTFEGDPANAVYLLDERPEGLLAHTVGAPNNLSSTTLRGFGEASFPERCIIFGSRTSGSLP